MPKAQSIVRLQSWPNRTPTGRPSATAVRNLAHYLAFGRGSRAEQAQRPQRGTWYAEQGQPLSHEAVLAWVQQQGRQHNYTHQLILSAPNGTLPAAAYNQALRAGGRFFDQWRLIVHQDTDHAHAHVLAFGHNEVQITGREFRQWWMAVRLSLDAQQQQALAAPPVQALTNALAGAERPYPHTTPQWDMEVQL